jgi:hypothetical protein
MGAFALGMPAGRLTPTARLRLLEDEGFFGGLSLDRRICQASPDSRIWTWQAVSQFPIAMCFSHPSRSNSWSEQGKRVRSAVW